MRTPNLGARAFIPMALAGAVLFTLAPSSVTPAAAAGPKTEAQQIIKIAKQQLGDPWRYSANGPRAFDCSGLVIYAFKKAGDGKAIGNGRYRSARALYAYFKARGLADRKNPKPGDLVIWGRGTHVGIYIGKGKAISTLTSGVRIHGVRAVRASFTAYLHTGMWKKSTSGGTVTAPAPEPTVSPTPTESAAPTESPTPTEVPTTEAAAVAPVVAVTPAPVKAPAPVIRRTDGAVNLRKGPGIRKQRITTLRDDTRLVVLGKARDDRGRTWIKVRAGQRVGWVARWLTDRG